MCSNYHSYCILQNFYFSTPPVSRYSSRSYTRSMRHGNRIAPTMMSDYSGGDQAVYARVNKLPPLDNSRRYLVASEVRHLYTLFFICRLYQSIIHTLIGFYPLLYQ